MKRFITALACLPLLLALTLPAQAASIAEWDLYGQPGSQVSTPGSGAAHVTALDMVRGPGLAPNSGSDSFNSKGWSGSDAGDYIQFGFTMESGYEAHLFQLWIATRSSNTGPGTLGVFTSVDNFAAPLATIQQNGTQYSNSKIDLLSLGMVSGDFLVRLIEIGDTKADGSGATTGSGTLRVINHYEAGTFSNVQFVGAVCPVVPVPASVWAFAFGLMLLVGIRRFQS